MVSTSRPEWWRVGHGSKVLQIHRRCRSSVQMIDRTRLDVLCPCLSNFAGAKPILHTGWCFSQIRSLPPIRRFDIQHPPIVRPADKLPTQITVGNIAEVST
mmetsp:Transcript_22595/g.53393  ORF Transcript_22595/g.53393 Transcript_22595/m.53393 type:complete len:101 (-) Transcript_22595:664-966(-)